MKVLYITYIDFSSSASGSAMRPQRMYEAFLRSGHEIRLLSGSQEIRHRKARIAAVRDVISWLRVNTPDLCYIESPVYPILWHADRFLLRKLHRMGVPMGYFYRDFYSKFKSSFPERTSLSGKLKGMALRILQSRTDALLKKADIVYVPSEEAAALLPYRHIRVLPPGGEDHISECVPEEHRCLYVGGIVNQYSGELLLRAFQILNGEGNRYPLTLICREAEWAQMPGELKTGSWLTVLHLNGDAIKPYLRQASLGLVVGTAEHPYNQIAVSVKLYEYAGYGLPIVYLHNTPMDRIVGAARIGEGADATPEALADTVRRVLDNEGVYAQYRRNMEAFLREGNTWDHRVKTILSDLSENKG